MFSFPPKKILYHDLSSFPGPGFYVPTFHITQLLVTHLVCEAHGLQALRDGLLTWDDPRRPEIRNILVAMEPDIVHLYSIYIYM